MEKKRLLITGGSGYLGNKLIDMAVNDWDVLYTYFNNPVKRLGAKGVSLNILDKELTLRLFQDFQPYAVVHTAYSEEDLEVIIRGSRHIASASQIAGARLIHISTDAVFDGERGWYREDEIPTPIHPYGRAKLVSEQTVAGLRFLPDGDEHPSKMLDLWNSSLTSGNTVIVRTSLIWGLSPIDGKTRRIRDCLVNKKRIVLFTDEYRCPIYVEELSAAILELLGLTFCGIVHIAGPERMNRYDFGIIMAKKLGLNSSFITPGLNRESGLVRPRDCSLDTSLARRLLNTKLSSPSEVPV